MTGNSLVCLAGSSEPDLDLVVFPGAGAGPGSLACWRGLLPEGWRLNVVCFPGRGTRLAESVGDNAAPIIDDAVEAIEQARSDATRPLLLFGHSIGALWALEAATKLAPTALVAAGCRSPGPGCPFPAIISTDEQDREFIKAIMMAYGLPESALLDQLVSASVPILQADIALANAWRAPAIALDCPIVSYHGTEEHVSDDSWDRHTTAWAEQVTIPGDHFFYQTSAAVLLRDMAQRLAPVTCVPNGLS